MIFFLLLLLHSNGEVNGDLRPILHLISRCDYRSEPPIPKCFSRGWIESEIAVHEDNDVINMFLSSKSQCSFGFPNQISRCTFQWNKVATVVKNIGLHRSQALPPDFSKFFLNGQTFACPSSNFERYSFESSFPTKSSQWLTIQIPFKRNHRDLQCCSKILLFVVVKIPSTLSTHICCIALSRPLHKFGKSFYFLRRDPAYYLLNDVDVDLTASMSDRFHRHLRCCETFEQPSFGLNCLHVKV